MNVLSEINSYWKCMWQPGESDSERKLTDAFFIWHVKNSYFIIRGASIQIHMDYLPTVRANASMQQATTATTTKK